MIEWRKVEDGLPPAAVDNGDMSMSDYVLVYGTINGASGYVDYTRCVGGKWWMIDAQHDYDDILVTHWAYVNLPEEREESNERHPRRKTHIREIY